MKRRLRAIALFLLAFSAAPAADEVALYDFVHTALDGKEATLAPYRGKVLVVEFFATWCPPCRKDLPDIASLQDEYPVEKVAIVAISADGSSKTAHRLPAFLLEMGIKIPVLVGGEIFVDRYTGVEQKGGRQLVLPQTYVFDGEGELLLRFVGERKTKRKTLTEELDRILRGASS